MNLQNKEEFNCQKFIPNKFKRNICMECFYDISLHQNTSCEEQLAATLYKDDSNPCKITEGLYIGSMKAAINLKALEDCKITHIINCAKELPKLWPKFQQYSNLFKYLNLEMEDTRIQRLEESIIKSYNFIKKSHDEGGNVLIHCVQGVSRSCSIVIAFLMKNHNLKFIQALELIKKVRPICNPNENFEKQLIDLENKF